MKNNLKPTLTLSAICVAVALLLSVINMVTGPIIEAQRNAAASGALLVVMPDGNGFEELDISTLNLPLAVTNAYKETSGKGYVFRVTSTGYKSGMVVMVGVSSDGKVTGSKCLETQDTFGKEPQLDNQYNGQSLSDFSPIMISGATMTSGGYRDAIDTALQAFVLTTGGKLDPSIELKAMIPSLHTGLTAGGSFKADAVEVSGNIVEGYKALNGSGYAFIIKSGEESVLAIVNATGVCKIYDTTGADVTESNTSARDEVLSTIVKADFAENAQKMLTVEYADATDITAIELNTFGNVVYACSFKTGGNTYYAFYSCPLTYDNNAMAVCTVINENGAIVSQNVKQLAFGHGVEYMPGINEYLDKSSDKYAEYLDRFNGITEGTLTDGVLISGATVSSTAVKLATQDAFNEFNAIKGGEQ